MPYVFKSGQPIKVDAKTGKLTGGTYYLHYYSPLGNHNFGVLFLIIAVGATQRVISFFEDKQEGN